MNLSYKRLVEIIGASSLLFLFSFLKHSFSLGSFYCSFSGTSLAPLLGLFFNFSEIGIIFTLYAIITSLVKGSFFLPFFTTFGIPTLLASLYFSSSHQCFTSKKLNVIADAVLKVGFPLTCMALFFIHPIGHNAFFYSFYWIIPMAVYVASLFSAHIKNSLGATALASTFIAHAAGSIIYLYRFNLTAQQWNSLIPVVAAERLIIASSMIVIMYALNVVCTYAFSSNRKNIGKAQ